MIALGFLNPWMLWMLPLAAVPIIIHLLNKRRFNKLRWAAMSFLLAAMKRNRRRMRMEQWLILALRTLAIILLVLLVSRPRLDEAVFGTTTKHHVVCIDDSASMAQRGAASSAFEDAIEAVQNLVSGLAGSRDGDLLTIALGSRPEQPILPVTRIGSDTAGRVREELAKQIVGEGRFDVEKALAAAAAQFAAAEDAEHAEYYVATDMRAIDWLDAEGNPNPAARKWLLERDAQKESVTFLTLGSNDPSNISIIELKCRDRVMTVGLPVTFAIDVTNNGLDTSPDGEVTVEIDERSRTSFPLPPLGANETTTIEFAHTFHAAGDHGVTASLEGDRFAVDDRRALSIDVREHSRVLVVDGDPGDSLEDSETYFLHAALEIRGAIDSGIEVRLIGDHELGDMEDEELAGFDMVWLCNISRPHERAIERLDGFVRSGGGLVTFLGNQVDLGYYNEKMYKNGDGPLPARLVEVSGDLDDPESLHLAAKDDPLFANNTEDAEFMLEQLVLVGRYVVVDASPESGARTIVRVRDDEGAPYLVARDIDAGRSYLVASTADAHWNSMPLAPVFVLTMVSMHRSAARPQRFDEANFEPDGIAMFDLDPGRHRRDVTVAPFGDSLGDVKTFSAPPDSTEVAAVQVPMRDLTGYGLFEAKLQRHDGSSDGHLVSRNPYTIEGRLGRVSSETFRRTYPEELADRLEFVGHDDTGPTEVITAGGSATWRWLGIALLAFMLIETLLAWRFGRR